MSAAPRALIAAVLDTLQEFAGAAKPSDNITMLACRWLTLLLLNEKK